jgi:hypothetical protein
VEAAVVEVLLPVLQVLVVVAAVVVVEGHHFVHFVRVIVNFLHFI